MNTNLPGVIVKNPNDNLGTQNVIANPGGAQNGNLDSNAGLNVQNGQPANLGGPANNQGIPVAQVMGNPPLPTHILQSVEQTIIPPRLVCIPARLVEEDNWEDWMSNVDEPTESDKKLCMLEGRMHKFESQGAVGFDMSDLGLVPRVKIPPKFKVLDFVKYKGISCPKTHVKSFYQKMSAYSDDEKLLMHFF